MMAAFSRDPAKRERQSSGSGSGPLSVRPNHWSTTLAVRLIILLTLAGQSLAGKDLPPQTLAELVAREMPKKLIFDYETFDDKESKCKGKPICPPNIYWRVEWRYDNTTHVWTWDYPVTSHGPGYQRVKERRFDNPFHGCYGKGKPLAGDPTQARPVPAAGSTVWYYPPDPHNKVSPEDTGMPPQKRAYQPFATPQTAGYPYFTPTYTRLDEIAGKPRPDMVWLYALGSSAFPMFDSKSWDVEYWDPAMGDPTRTAPFRHEWHGGFNCLHGTEDKVGTPVAAAPASGKPSVAVPSGSGTPPVASVTRRGSKRQPAASATTIQPNPLQAMPLEQLLAEIEGKPKGGTEKAGSKGGSTSSRSSKRKNQAPNIPQQVNQPVPKLNVVPPKVNQPIKEGPPKSGPPKEEQPTKEGPPQGEQPIKEGPPKEGPIKNENQQKIASGGRDPGGPGGPDDDDDDNNNPDGNNPPPITPPRGTPNKGTPDSGMPRSSTKKSPAPLPPGSPSGPGHAGISSVRKALFLHESELIRSFAISSLKTDMEMNPWKKHHLDSANINEDFGWWFEKAAVQIHVPAEVNDPGKEDSFGQRAPVWLRDYSFLVSSQMWIMLHAPRHNPNDVPMIDEKLTHKGLLVPQSRLRDKYIVMKMKDRNVEDLDAAQGRFLLLRPTPPLRRTREVSTEAMKTVFEGLTVPGDHLNPAPYIPYDWYATYHTKQLHGVDLPHYYEYLTLAWSWVPTYRMKINKPRQDNMDKWMVHGLWPSLYTQKIVTTNQGRVYHNGPVDCHNFTQEDKKDQFDDMNHWFRDLPAARKESLRMYWMSGYGDGQETESAGLWLEEWRKHGTCAHWSSPHFVPRHMPAKGEVIDPAAKRANQKAMMKRYFEVTLRLAEMFPIAKEWSGYYKPRDLRVEQNLPGFQIDTIKGHIESQLARLEGVPLHRRRGAVLLSCSTVGPLNRLVLKEVHICLHPVSLKPVHCGANREDPGCGEATHVHYPSK